VPSGFQSLDAQSTTATGWLTAIFTEAESPSPPLRYFLALNDGRRIELLLDAQSAALVTGDALRLGFQARAEFDREPAAARGPARAIRPAHRVRRLTRLSAPSASSSAGLATTYAYITILCRFADISTEPFTPAQVQSRMGSGYPGADHYFGELSAGQASMAGSVTQGWFSLPKPRSQYVAGTSMDFTGLTDDCLAAADSSVDFASYHGVVLQFNAGLSVRATAPYDTLSFGGRYFVDRDSTNRVLPMVWMSREHVFNYVVLHHELGHSLGWPHSSGPYGQTYDSNWDIMSRGYVFPDPVFGWLGPHTVAYHKLLSAWISPARTWRPGGGDPASFLLWRTALPSSGPGYQAAVIPIPGGNRYYTVESRLVLGYDRGFPAEGVVIHEVDPARLDRTAQVVDPDGNSNPNDDAATWVPGELFSDPSFGLELRVDSVTADGHWLTVGVQGIRLASTGRSRSALLGDSTLQPDSVALQVFGAGASSADWTVTHLAGAGWNTVLTPSGQGSATIRWVSNPTGLALGTYVDTLTILVPGTLARDSLLVDSLVVYEPVVSVACASSTLLATGSCLGQVERHYLDLNGNRDGVYNLGDLLAWLDRKGMSLPAALPGRPVVGNRDALAPGKAAGDTRWDRP
jgi:M6 family metalloprotease-like protein